MRARRAGAVLALVLLALGGSSAIAATPIQEGVYNFSANRGMYTVQVLAFPKTHDVAVTLSGVPNCHMGPRLPDHIRLRTNNTFAAKGASQPFGHHRIEHIAVSGRFPTPKKALLVLTDCKKHKHHLTLHYIGLAGLGP